jgi:hypothetical protein
MFRTDRTNTTILNFLMFHVILKGFMTPGRACNAWAVPRRTISWQFLSHQGLVRAHRGRTPLAHGKLTYLGWTLLMGAEFGTWHSVSYSPRLTLDWSLKVFVKWVAILQAGESNSSSVASFPVLLTETLGYHCAANRIKVLCCQITMPLNKTKFPS